MKSSVDSASLRQYRHRNKSAASRKEFGLEVRSVFEKDEKSSKANFRIGKRKGRVLGKPSDVIPSLLKSIKDHRRFKQLATYSIDCVTKVVDEIHSNWEANVKECIREQISEVCCRFLAQCFVHLSMFLFI